MTECIITAFAFLFNLMNRDFISLRKDKCKVDGPTFIPCSAHNPTYGQTCGHTDIRTKNLTGTLTENNDLTVSYAGKKLMWILYFVVN